LNALRNNFAHKVDYKFADKDKADLLNAMPSYVTKVILSDGDGSEMYTRENLPLERILRVLVCLIEARRRDFVERKEAEQAAVDRLREVLDRSKNRGGGAQGGTA
jgi:hypothetical protein